MSITSEYRNRRDKPHIYLYTSVLENKWWAVSYPASDWDASQQQMWEKARSFVTHQNEKEGR